MKGIFSVPEIKDFYVQTDVKAKLEAVKAWSDAGKNVNVLLSGLPGSGKTELGQQLAARWGRKHLSTEIGLLSEAGQIFGQQTLKDGKIEYVLTAFVEAVQTPGAIITMDEINREERPEALNALLPVLDDRRCLFIDELQLEVKVAEGVVFFATINEGIQFAGTKELDAAIRDRFYILYLQHLPVEQETKLYQKRLGMQPDVATKLAMLMARLRGIGAEAHTRKGLQIGAALMAGLSWMDALSFALTLESEVVEAALYQLDQFGEKLQEVVEASFVEL